MQLFNTLPADIKGHSMRTGIALQIFMAKIITDYPDYQIKEKNRIESAHVIECAREFGFYHHLDEAKLKGGASADAPHAIASIFRGSWNANGYYVQGLLDTVESHRERWDGNGLPSGLKKEEIPFWGRTCAIAEEYDIQTAVRGISQREAMRFLMHAAGTSFDPALVSIFTACTKELHIIRK